MHSMPTILPAHVDLDRGDQRLNRHSLLQRRFDFLFVGGHLAPGAPVEECDRRDVLLAQGDTGRIDRRIPAADNADVPVGQLFTSEVERLEELHGGVDALQILSFEVQPPTLVRAGRQEDRLVPLGEQPLDGHIWAEDNAGAQGDVLVHQGLDFVPDDASRQAVGGQRTGEHTAGFLFGLKYGDFMPENREAMGGCESCRAGADDRDLLGPAVC